MTPRRRLPEPPRLSDAEWEVMNVVWGVADPSVQEPVTAQEVVATLAGTRDWSPQTIKTMLARLVKKGALVTEPDGKRYMYRAAVAREACQRLEGKNFVQRVLGGSPAGMLAYFVREGRLSRDEIEELRALLDREEKR